MLTHVVGRRAGLTLVKLAVAVAVFGVLVWACLWDLGCFGSKGEPAAQSGLPARLAGEWASAEGKGTTVFFTAGTNRLVFGQSSKNTYDFTSCSERTITIKTQRSRGGWRGDLEPFDLKIEIEFASDNEFVAIFPTDASGCSPYLKGRYRRTKSLPDNTARFEDPDLKGVILGEWAKSGDGVSSLEYKISFSEKTLEARWSEPSDSRFRGSDDRSGKTVCSYRRDGDRIEIIDSLGKTGLFVCEFTSGSEVVFAQVKGENKSGTWVPETDQKMLHVFQGRWKRVSLPPSLLVNTGKDSASVVAAKQQVKRIEQKLKKVESLREDAVVERDQMVAKLREMGVAGAADLKGNTRARGIAENLAKLAAEVEGMDSQLATIDTQLLKARSIVRRIEREQAGISDDEMRQLSAQLRDAEARTEAAPTPITTLDVDAAVEAALKGRRAAPGEKR